MKNYVNFALDRISEDARKLYYYVLENQSYGDDFQGISLGIEDIRQIIGCARQKAVLLKQVLVGVGLLENIRLGLGHKNILYAVPANYYENETPDNRGDNHKEENKNMVESNVVDNTNNTAVLNELPYINSVETRKIEHLKLKIDKKSDYDKYQEMRSEVMQNINFVDLVQKYEKNRVLGIVQLITEVMLSDDDRIVIAKQRRYTAQVKQQLLALQYKHIEYVFECIDKQKTQIHNMKNYLLTCLYNATTTIDSYYKNLVQYELYGA